jgi:hypothetical protein
MRKILASIATILVFNSLAGVALAGSIGTQTISTPTGYDSVHSGTVTATCTVNVKDGELPTDQELVTNLVTIGSNRGKISTVCNNASSSLLVTLATGSAPAQPNYSEDFKLINGTGAYPVAPMSGYGTTYSKLNLINGYSNTPSTLEVVARAKVLAGYYLAPGTYTVKVKATVTP